MAEMFDMGKYGAYVWPAYGLALFILIINVVLPHLREKQVTQQIAKRLRREARSEQS